MKSKRIKIAAIAAICLIGVSVPAAMAVHHATSTDNQAAVSAETTPSAQESKAADTASGKKTDTGDRKKFTGNAASEKTDSKANAKVTDSDVKNKDKQSGSTTDKTSASKKAQKQDKSDNKTAPSNRSESNKSCTPGTPAKTHTERRMTSPAHNEQQVVTPARTERVLVTPARTVQHPAVTHVEPVYEIQWVNVYRYPDGYVVSGRAPTEDEDFEHGDPGIVSEPAMIYALTSVRFCPYIL